MPPDDDDLDALDDDDPVTRKETFGAKRAHQVSNDDMNERKKALFGASSIGSGGNKPDTRNKVGAHSASQEHIDDLNALHTGALVKRNSYIPSSGNSPGQHLSQDGISNDSGIDVIETAYSRAKTQKRMLARPPTASGANAQDSQHSGGSNNMAISQMQQNRPHTGPQSRPPLAS